MKTYMLLISFIIFMPFHSFALAPKTGMNSSLLLRNNLVEINEILNDARDKINSDYGFEAVSEVFIFGSPFILNKDGQLELENINDFDVMILINMKYKDVVNFDDLNDKFNLELEQHVVFRGKKLDLVPRVINRAFFKLFFRKYLNESYERLKQNQVMLDAEWFEVSGINLTKKYIKRFMEQLLFRDGYSDLFFDFKNRFLLCESSQDFYDLKADIEEFLALRLFDLKLFMFNDPLEIIEMFQAQERFAGRPIDNISFSDECAFAA